MWNRIAALPDIKDVTIMFVTLRVEAEYDKFFKWTSKPEIGRVAKLDV